MADTVKNKQKKEDLTLFETSVSIPEDARTQVISIINQALAEVFDLYSQTKQAHWNVKGPNFFQFHELFDKLAEMIFPFVDELAERATALGGIAKGTARMAATSSNLAESPNIHGGIELVEALIQRYGSLANSCRDAVDETEKLEDMATSDLFIEIVHVLDKSLYFLESHIQI